MLRLLVEQRYRLLWLAVSLCLAGLILYEHTPVELLPRTSPRRVAVVVPHGLAPDGHEVRDTERTVRLELAGIAPIEETVSEVTSEKLVSVVSFAHEISQRESSLAASLGDALRRQGLPHQVYVAALGPESVAVMDLVIEPKRSNGFAKMNPHFFRQVGAELLKLAEVAGVSFSGEEMEKTELTLRDGHGPMSAGLPRQAARALALPTHSLSRAFGKVTFSRGTSGPEGLPLDASGTAGDSTLGERFKIENLDSESRTLVLSDGNPAVVVRVFKTSDASEIATSSAVRKTLAEINARTADALVRVVSDSSDYIKAAQENVNENLKWAVILTCACILALAKNVRYTLIVSMSIPLSLFLTFPFLYALGISRNVMSLAGITLSVGVVVDATISVVDSIDEGISHGCAPTEAAWHAARENLTPVMLTSLTTLAVFIPILFLPGTVGDLFRDLSTTVIVSQIIAFCVAIFLVPGLTSMAYERLQAMNLLRLESGGNDGRGLIVHFFLKCVHMVTANRLTIWSTALLLLLLAVWGVTLLPPSEFLPKRFTNELRVRVDLGETPSERERRRLAVELDAELVRMGGAARLITADTGTLVADTVSGADQMQPAAIERDLQKAFPGKKIMAAFRNPLDPDASEGRDLDFLIPRDGGGRSFREALARIGGVAHVTWSDEGLESQALLSLQSASALALPVEPQDAPRFLASLYGSLPVGLGPPLFPGEMPRPLYLKQKFPLHPATETTLSPTLASYVSELRRSPKREILLNGIPVLRAEIQVRNRTSSEVAADIEKLAGQERLPLSWGNSHTESRRSLTSMGVSLGIASLIIMAILLAQNRSLGMTMVILFTFVWSLIGSIPALALHRETLNASALVGFILLAGTIVNNGILLMEIIDRSRRKQLSPLESCLTAVRSRTVPVLVTALTTAIGMIPMAFDVGEGSQMYRALSIVVVYGTIASTPLSLLGIPCMVLIVCDLREDLNKVRLRIATRLLGAVSHSAGDAHEK